MFSLWLLKILLFNYLQRKGLFIFHSLSLETFCKSTLIIRILTFSQGILLQIVSVSNTSISFLDSLLHDQFLLHQYWINLVILQAKWIIKVSEIQSKIHILPLFIINLSNRSMKSFFLKSIRSKAFLRRYKRLNRNVNSSIKPNCNTMRKHNFC